MSHIEIGIRAPSYRELGDNPLRVFSRIAAINLDDYQHVPVTPPPSPSSPLSMAAYQRMIAEMDPTQKEGALTTTPPYGTEIEPRVEENQWETPSVDELISQFRQMCEDVEDRARDAQEKA
ncbi:hypothetical protein Tco_0706949 [Tanacetum coccineum]|uniref:Uncharacterized protein n=1 Tax=Tanacetum coccineum TaxID=301880 RepID=A0ABQ4YAF2_9ASTR